MINPLPFSGLRVVDDVAEELDGQHVLRASLLPRVAVTEPIVGFLNLVIIKKSLISINEINNEKWTSLSKNGRISW